MTASLSSHMASRTQPGLPEPEARVLQGAGPGRLRGLALEEEGRQGLLLPEVEEVLVRPEGQLPVLVHQRGGKSSMVEDHGVIKTKSADTEICHNPDLLTLIPAVRKLKLAIWACFVSSFSRIIGSRF